MAKEQEYGLLLEQGCTMREAALLAAVSRITDIPVTILGRFFGDELTKAKEFDLWNKVETDP